MEDGPRRFNLVTQFTFNIELTAMIWPVMMLKVA